MGGDNVFLCQIDPIMEDVFSTIVMLRTPGGGSLRMELEKGSMRLDAGAPLRVHITPENVLLLLD